MEDEGKMHEGVCACGGIRVRVRGGALGAMVLCHCAQCRKSAGAPFLAVVPAPVAACELEDPQGLLREYRATPDKARCFCARCGAPVLSRRDGADVVRLRAGLFDDLGAARPAAHIFTAAAVPWHRDSDQRPRYTGFEPGRSGAATREGGE